MTEVVCEQIGTAHSDWSGLRVCFEAVPPPILGDPSAGDQQDRSCAAKDARRFEIKPGLAVEFEPESDPRLIFQVDSQSLTALGPLPCDSVSLMHMLMELDDRLGRRFFQDRIREHGVEALREIYLDIANAPPEQLYFFRTCGVLFKLAAGKNPKEAGGTNIEVCIKNEAGTVVHRAPAPVLAQVQHVEQLAASLIVGLNIDKQQDPFLSSAVDADIAAINSALSRFHTACRLYQSGFSTKEVAEKMLLGPETVTNWWHGRAVPEALALRQRHIESPKVDLLKLPEPAFRDLAYFLGALAGKSLGNLSENSFAFSHRSREVMERLQRCIKSISGKDVKIHPRNSTATKKACFEIRFTDRPLMRTLSELTEQGTRVPFEVLAETAERSSYVSGFFDFGVSLNKSRIQYRTESLPGMVKGVAVLLKTLGVFANVCIAPAPGESVLNINSAIGLQALDKMGGVFTEEARRSDLAERVSENPPKNKYTAAQYYAVMEFDLSQIGLSAIAERTGVSQDAVKKWLKLGARPAWVKCLEAVCEIEKEVGDPRVAAHLYRRCGLPSGAAREIAKEVGYEQLLERLDLLAWLDVEPAQHFDLLYLEAVELERKLTDSVDLQTELGDDRLATIDETLLLSPELERVLSFASLKGDLRAQNRLVFGALFLAIRIAGEFTGGPLSVNDLIHEGLLSLSEHVGKFDARLGRLSTFADDWIKLGMREALKDPGRTYRTPVYLHQEVAALSEGDRFLRILPERELAILRGRFPGDGTERLTWTELGQRWESTGERVRQIETQLLAALNIFLTDHREIPDLAEEDAKLENWIPVLLPGLDAQRRLWAEHHFQTEGAGPMGTDTLSERLGINPADLPHFNSEALMQLWHLKRALKCALNMEKSDNEVPRSLQQGEPPDLVEESRPDVSPEPLPPPAPSAQQLLRLDLREFSELPDTKSFLSKWWASRRPETARHVIARLAERVGKLPGELDDSDFCRVVLPQYGKTLESLWIFHQRQAFAESRQAVLEALHARIPPDSVPFRLNRVIARQLLNFRDLPSCGRLLPQTLTILFTKLCETRGVASHELLFADAWSVNLPQFGKPLQAVVRYHALQNGVSDEEAWGVMRYANWFDAIAPDQQRIREVKLQQLLSASAALRKRIHEFLPSLDGQQRYVAERLFEVNGCARQSDPDTARAIGLEPKDLPEFEREVVRRLFLLRRRGEER